MKTKETGQKPCQIFPCMFVYICVILEKSFIFSNEKKQTFSLKVDKHRVKRAQVKQIKTSRKNIKRAMKNARYYQAVSVVQFQ